MAKPRKNKPTPNQVEFRQQRRRIQNIISAARRKGIIVPSVDEFIKQPQRITKKYLEHLQALKPKDIRRMGYIINPQTGEAIQYEEPSRPKTRKERLPKAPSPEPIQIQTSQSASTLFIEKQIIYIFRTFFVNARNKETADLLTELLDAQIEKEGEYEVAKRLAKLDDNLKELCQVVAYHSKAEEVFNSAVVLAKAIMGKDFTTTIQLKISEVGVKDNPYSFRRNRRR